MNLPYPFTDRKLTHSTVQFSKSVNPALLRFLLVDGLGMLGGLFYQLALPGLVLAGSGSAGAVGLAILATGAARIGLVLAGGALCDRFSPRGLLVGANLLRAGLLLGLWGVEMAGGAGLAAIYAFSLAFGVCDAVQFPARGALIPRLAGSNGLQAVNGLLSSQEKAIGLVGPALIGLLLAWLSRVNLSGEGGGLILAGLGLGTSSLILSRITLPRRDPAARASPAAKPAPASFRELVHLLWCEPAIRGSVAMVLGVNALSVGPLCVGLPVLAAGRFAESAQALGLLLSTAGGGALLGTTLAGLLPAIQPRYTGRTALAAIAALALGLAALGLATDVWVAAAAAGWIAAVSACANVIGLAQVQATTPPALLGRMMGLLNVK